MEKDKIGDRLRETSTRCLTAFEGWLTDEKDPKKREELRESIHELRKVSSRLEIEMAVSERDEVAQKPIPIPPHRAARGRRRPNESAAEDNAGNRNPDSPAPQDSDKPKPRSPRRSGGQGQRKSG